MKILNVSEHHLDIRIDQQELLILNSALNEIVNGLALFEFETRIGANRDRAAKLLEEIALACDLTDIKRR